MSNSRKPDVSVIVIFHNAERTLERTLHSLAAQSLETVEYIFVDDGSLDRSVDVIRGFLALNPEFAGRHLLVQSPMQRGTGHATTLGLAHASGEYVIRCDADDILDSDGLRMMLNGSGGKTADVVAGDYFEENETGRLKPHRFCPQVENLNDMPINTVHFSLCNKLIRRKLLVDENIVPFNGVDCWEDLGIVARVMALRPKFVSIGKPVFHYRVERGRESMSRSPRARLLEDHLVTALLLEQWMVERGLEKENEEFLNHLKFCSKVKMMRGRDKNVRRWKDTFPEVNGRIMGLRHIGLHWRLLFSLVALLPTGLTQWFADVCDVFYANPAAVPPNKHQEP